MKKNPRVSPILLQLFPADEEVARPGFFHAPSVRSLHDAIEDEGVDCLYVSPKCTAVGIAQEIIALAASSGLALALYKLLRLWIDERNGRRFKIKVDDIEVEATQLSEASFMRLVEKVQELRTSPMEETQNGTVDQSEQMQSLAAELRAEGVQVEVLPLQRNWILYELREAMEHSDADTVSDEEQA